MNVKPSGARSPEPARETFPRSARLLKPSDFKRVFRKNAVSADRFFRVIARPAEVERSRIGMAVSRKVDKKAVGRNRIKRVVRESFRHWRAGDAENKAAALDVVVLARPDCASICKKQLFNSLERHWLAVARSAAKKFPANHQPEEQE